MVVKGAPSKDAIQAKIMSIQIYWMCTKFHKLFSHLHFSYTYLYSSSVNNIYKIAIYCPLNVKTWLFIKSRLTENKTGVLNSLGLGAWFWFIFIFSFHQKNHRLHHPLYCLHPFPQTQASHHMCFTQCSEMVSHFNTVGRKLFLCEISHNKLCGCSWQF